MRSLPNSPLPISIFPKQPRIFLFPSSPIPFCVHRAISIESSFGFDRDSNKSHSPSTLHSFVPRLPCRRFPCKYLLSFSVDPHGNPDFQRAQPSPLSFFDLQCVFLSSSSPLSRLLLLNTCVSFLQTACALTQELESLPSLFPEGPSSSSSRAFCMHTKGNTVQASPLP